MAHFEDLPERDSDARIDGGPRDQDGELKDHQNRHVQDDDHRDRVPGERPAGAGFGQHPEHRCRRLHRRDDAPDQGQPGDDIGRPSARMASTGSRRTPGQGSGKDDDLRRDGGRQPAESGAEHVEAELGAGGQGDQRQGEPVHLLQRDHRRAVDERQHVGTRQQPRRQIAGQMGKLQRLDQLGAQAAGEQEEPQTGEDMGGFGGARSRREVSGQPDDGERHDQTEERADHLARRNTPSLLR